jgi:hypothetical protein
VHSTGQAVDAAMVALDEFRYSLMAMTDEMTPVVIKVKAPSE